MTESPLAERYRQYIDCLNERDLDRLGDFVRDDVRHDSRDLGLAGYQAMLRDDYRAIPDLRFTIALLVADATHVAARLEFDCTPVGEFRGLAVDGRRVVFHEHVFYAYEDGRIADVRSVIDTAAVADQLAPAPGSTRA